jgi:CheY-specific phosphatase CheX
MEEEIDSYTSILIRIESILVSNLTRVYQTMVNEKLLPITLENTEIFKECYTAVIDLNGVSSDDDDVKTKINANLSLTWDIPGYIKMASMFMGQEYSSYTEDIDDIGMEIINTVVGNSKRDLRGKSILIEMAIPTGLVGENKGAIEDLKKAYTRHTHMKSNLGTLTMILTASK